MVQIRVAKSKVHPYRAFARTGDGKLPDAKALGHWRDWDKPSGLSNRASGAWCKEEGATVVETNIHTATDSCLFLNLKGTGSLAFFRSDEAH